MLTRQTSTKCPNPGVALIWATPLPPLRFTPHEHLASPREMGSIASLARARTLQLFSSVQDLGHFPSATHTAARCGFVGARGPHWLLCRSSVAASGRKGFSATARVNTGDGAAWRLAPGSSAWCTRGAAGAQVRLRKWAAEPASSSGSATIKPTGRIRDRRIVPRDVSYPN